MTASEETPETKPGVPVTQKLGAWASKLQYSDLPSAVVERLRLCILDSIGCGLYGAAQPWGRISADVAIELSGGGKSSLFARAEKASPSDAALANGTAVHGFEMDDLHVAGMSHPGSVTLPAALAIGEAENVSGREFLVAMAAGYEVGIRIGVAAGVTHSTSGYHGAATAGTFNAAAAAARILKLDPNGATNALGIAATQAAGLYSARMGAMTKRFHAGRAAQSGVLAGYLAAKGFTGSQIAIEAPFGGFMSTMRGQADPATILEGLGERWEILNVGFKIHAACGSTHTTIDALDDLTAKGLTADNLDKLTIRMTKKALTNVGWPYQPNGIVGGQMNGYYVAAVKLLEGAAFIDQFREELLADPRILALIGRIELIHDPELDAGGATMRHSVRVEARLKDGRVLTTSLQNRKGSAERPVGADVIEAKFRTIAAVALSPEAIRRTIEIARGIEDEPNLADLVELLSGRFDGGTGIPGASKGQGTPLHLQ